MSEELNYADKHVPTGQTDRAALPWTITLLALTAMAVFTCVRIEVLNVMAGGLLPQDMVTDPGPWRVSYLSNETQWRGMQARMHDDPTWIVRPLTGAEIAEMKREVHQAVNAAALEWTTHTLGLLQYPLVFALLIGLPFALRRHRSRKWRGIIGASFGLLVICGVLMIYRGYFASLGI